MVNNPVERRRTQGDGLHLDSLRRRALDSYFVTTGSYSTAMRVLWLLSVVAALPLALGGWASASEGVVPTCTAQDVKSQHVITRDGYSFVCGPGSAAVKFKGITYRMKHSRCFISPNGARLYFGVTSRHRENPLNGLYLVIEPNRLGAVEVIDGGVTLSSGVETAILGKARAKSGLRRGTFIIFEHLGDGKTSSRRFTGSWNCG